MNRYCQRRTAQLETRSAYRLTAHPVTGIAVVHVREDNSRPRGRSASAPAAQTGAGRAV